MTRELVFDLSEIERIWFSCPKCKAEFPIVVAKNLAEQRQPFARSVCPACGAELSREFLDELNFFVASLARLSAGAKDSRVRISLTESED